MITLQMTTRLVLRRSPIFSLKPLIRRPVSLSSKPTGRRGQNHAAWTLVTPYPCPGSSILIPMIRLSKRPPALMIGGVRLRCRAINAESSDAVGANI
jgi:hypothetical protein